MRIIIVNDFASITGGASRVALTSATALAQAGHEVVLFAGAGPADPSLENAGVQVVCLEARVFQQRPTVDAMRDGLWDQAARDAFGLLLDEFSPTDTIVHIHSNRDALSASVPGLALKRGFPVVYTCHEYLLACPYGAFFDQRLGIRCPERGGSLRCWLRPCNGRAYHKKLWSMMRTVKHERAGIPSQIRDFVLVSDYSKRILEPYLPPEARLHRVDNPVDSRATAPKPVVPGEPFLMVGALHEGKNPLRAANAAGRAGTKLVLYGSGPLKDVIATAPAAELRGWADEATLQRMYQESRALVFVPIWPETQGLVVYEAAAQGLPSIVSRDCAAADFVADNEAGLLVDPLSESEIAEAITQLMDDALAAKLGENAFRAFWKNPPTLERYVRELVAVYAVAFEERWVE